MPKKYFIGTSGWNYGHWENRFYPKNLSQDKWLEFYSKHFNTVEINMTFYRWPKPSFLKSWHKRAPKNFKFTLKAPRTITHIRKLNNVKRQVKDFYRLADILKEKLACILWQLPPNFGPKEENINKLKKFLRLLNKKYRNVIEFRNEEWWNKGTYELLKKYKACFCTVSSLEMPKDSVITANFAYFRFHGENYSSCYSKKEMKKYAKEMKKVKVSVVYAYFNNDSNAYAIKNAVQLKTFLKPKS